MKMFRLTGKKMKLKLEDLRAAFAVVDTVAANPAAEASQFVRLAAGRGNLTLSLSGILWSSASLPLPEKSEWEFYADRRVLKSWLSTACKDEIDIACKDGKLSMRCGQSLDIPTHEPVSGYEVWQPSKTFSFPEEWQSILDSLRNYCPTMPGMEHVECCWFQKGWGAMATDLNVVAAVLDDKTPWTLMLPAAMTGVIKQFPAAKLCADKHMMDNPSIGKPEAVYGFGAVVPGGWIYQALDDALKQYPSTGIKDRIAAAIAVVDPLASAKVQDLSGAMQACSEFLLDKNETAMATPANGSLMIAVDVHGGKFQRRVLANCKAAEGIRWPVKQIAPWLQFCSGWAESVEWVRLEGASALRCSGDGQTYVLVFADF